MRPTPKDQAKVDALEAAALVCDAIGRRAKHPDNRRAQDPRAAFKSGAATCAWEIRALAKRLAGESR